MHSLILILLFLSLLATATSEEQHPFGTLSEPPLLSDSFTQLSHSEFPSHKIRVKRISPGICEDEKQATSYSGYLDIDDDKHLFFWWFESRNDPAKDDVIMWLNGGPGCSSMTGALVELGNGTVVNPYSWTNYASVFFLDQPVGVGFSYSSSNKTVGTSREAGHDVYAFLQIWTEAFPKYKHNAFHIAGESYGGHYVPIFATEIMKGGFMNLKSVMIGNAWDIACTSASGLDPVLNKSTCQEMAAHVARGDILVDACEAYKLDLICGLAGSYLYERLALPYILTGRNPYDVSQQCNDIDDLCFPIVGALNKYLNREDIRRQLGVNDSVPTFQTCNENTGLDFARTGDQWISTTNEVVYLLDKGVSVLIYAGEYDWICNWVGIQNWLTSKSFGWDGAPYFRSSSNRAWFVDRKQAGVTRSYEGLTWVTVAKAGHMVPYSRPVESLEMVKRWLKGEEM